MIRVLLCLLMFNAFSQAKPLTESFENGVPSSYVSYGGKLSVSNEHLLEGKSALRWDFKNGDAVVINTGALGNVNIRTGYGNYSRSCLVLPLFLNTQSDGHLLIEIRAGEETAGTISVPFVHIGWQKLVYHYSWNSKIKWAKANLRGKLDNLRISASGLNGPATAWFDHLYYNTPRDFRAARPAITKPWKPKINDFSARPEPIAEQLAQVEHLLCLLSPQPNPKVKRTYWEGRIKHYCNVINTQNLRKGYALKTAAHRQYGLLSGIANDWNRCTYPDLQRELAACFLTVNDWLQEQGLVVNGAVGKQNNYVGRTYVDAVTRMRAPLEEHGTLEATLDFIKWSYSYDERVFGEKTHESMDYFHNEATRILLIALTHGDPVVRWHHVAQFRDVLGKQLVGSVKVDGSIYHHGFHYFAYGSMGMNSISGTLAKMSEARLPVSKAALDIVRTALESMMWYCGRSTLWSLVGRNPSGNQMIPSSALFNLATAYAPYNSGQPAADLLAHFARYSPQQANQAGFGNITPSAAPTGHRTMPYAALGMQRRDHWLAGVKGYSKYSASGESYANANRYGLFLSMGQLELLSHPQGLPTVHGSGTRPNQGYDWTAIEGATTIHAPLDRIANGNGTRIPRSDETFVGGLSNRDNGLFVLTYNSHWTKYIMRDRPEGAAKPEPLTALKTWFFFDKMIVSLASGISTKHVSYPVRTTLFQKFLDKSFTTTHLNGEPLQLGEKVIERNAMGANLIDPYGNAYFTDEGTPVHLRISNQHSRDGSDKKDTSGNYATAWIEHGLDPKKQAYEYAVLVQPSAAEIASFDPSTAYTVLQQDAAAHIVYDKASKTTGFVIFDAEGSLPESTPLASVGQACLVMLEEHPDYYKLALTNPDARPKESDATQVTVSLRDECTAAVALPSGYALSTRDGQTTLKVPVRHGESIQIRLNKPAPANNPPAVAADSGSQSKAVIVGAILGTVALLLFGLVFRKK